MLVRSARPEATLGRAQYPPPSPPLNSQGFVPAGRPRDASRLNSFNKTLEPLQKLNIISILVKTFRIIYQLRFFCGLLYGIKQICRLVKIYFFLVTNVTIKGLGKSWLRNKGGEGYLYLSEGRPDLTRPLGQGGRKSVGIPSS